MSVAAQDMRDELNWSEAQKGLVLVWTLLHFVFELYNINPNMANAYLVNQYINHTDLLFCSELETYHEISL